MKICPISKTNSRKRLRVLSRFTTKLGVEQVAQLNERKKNLSNPIKCEDFNQLKVDQQYKSILKIRQWR